MSIRPADFKSEAPPDRPIGIECEYNLQLPDNERVISSAALLNSDALRATGIDNHGGYLGTTLGAGRVYSDMDHLEFDTREALGPASAAVEDIDGIERINTIVTHANVAHNGLYRLAGTYIRNGRVSNTDIRTSYGRSSGYHENYLVPRDVSEDPLVDALLPTMIASRIWAMNGTLRGDGFVLSQKVWGGGGHPVERSMSRRTEHMAKPMVLIPPAYADIDTIGDPNWTRYEVRVADPGLSLINRFASFAGISLVARLVEQQHRIGRERLFALALSDPIVAAKEYAGDLSLTRTCITNSQRHMTALNVQESLLDMFAELDEQIELPKDEKLAIVVIRGLVDALKTSNPIERDYGFTARTRIDFVPRHQFIAQDRPTEAVRADNEVAMQRNLRWDRILPTGSGLRYWQTVTERDELTPIVRNLAAEAGVLRRTALRMAIIDGKYPNQRVRNWSTYYDDLEQSQPLHTPIDR